MLEPEENGWWLVRFPDLPEALTEGETEQKAHANAADCLLAALEGYVKAGRPVPRPPSTSGNGHRVTLPSLATAKLAVYETMRSRGWSMTQLAQELDISKDALPRSPEQPLPPWVREAKAPVVQPLEAPVVHFTVHPPNQPARVSDPALMKERQTSPPSVSFPQQRLQRDQHAHVITCHSFPPLCLQHHSNTKL